MPSPVSLPADSEISAGLPDAAWRLLRIVAGIGLVSLVLLVAAHFHGAQLLSASQSLSSAPVRVVIGGEVLAVPENMIRHPADRRPGLASSLDLQVLWPEKTGFSRALASRFADTNPETTGIVLLSIAGRTSFLDMKARYEPVYRAAVLENSRTQLPGGLVRQSLDPAYGYIDEEIIHAPGSGLEPAFVARCQNPPPSVTPLLLACQTDIFFGEALEARVRFARHELDDWQAFSVGLERFLSGLVVRP